MVFGGSGHHRALSSGGGCAAGCGGERAEGGEGVGHLIGETGEDRRLAAEDGGFGAQRPACVEVAAATFGDGFGEELAEVFQLACDPVADSLGQGLIRIGIDLAGPGMDQRDGDALLSSAPLMSLCIATTPMLPTAPVRGRMIRSAWEARA